jgi:predicted GIY-YIG superfamily endonuclease
MRRLSGPKNWVLVVELDDVVRRRDPDKPNLYVGLTIEAPAIRYERLKLGYGPAWLHGHLVRLRDDLVSGPILSHDEAKREVRVAIRCLKSEGYTVNRDPRVWTVYVIEMDPKGCKDPGKGFLYVGETSKTPEERYKEHIKGKRSKRGRLYSRAVRKYGQRLRLDLAPEFRYFDAASSKAAEKRWARKLKDEGYKVAGGH